MKLKARDIIIGWPKGRSTTAAYGNKLYESFDCWPYLSILSAEMQGQMYTERLYHQMQQAMVNEWLARYRLGDEVFRKQHERFVLGGEYGTCIIVADFYTELDLEVLEILKNKKNRNS